MVNFVGKYLLFTCPQNFFLKIQNRNNQSPEEQMKIHIKRNRKDEVTLCAFHTQMQSGPLNISFKPPNIPQWFTFTLRCHDACVDPRKQFWNFRCSFGLFRYLRNVAFRSVGRLKILNWFPIHFRWNCAHWRKAHV